MKYLPLLFLVTTIVLSWTTVSGQVVYEDYYQAVEDARERELPLLIVFTGNSCKNVIQVNKWLLEDDEVTAAIGSSFILTMLYVDDRTLLPKEKVINRNGEEPTIRTYGALWANLEMKKFGYNSQPLIVKLNANNSILKTPSMIVDKQALIDYITTP